MTPARGEIWYAQLNPTRGHEQGGLRPVLVVSVNPYNQSRSELVVVLPITSRQRGIPCHIAIVPPDGGLKKPSDILCDAVRSITKERLERRIGSVCAATMTAVEERLRLLLGL